MAFDDGRADRWADWGDLGRALEAGEPLNVAEILRLRESNTSVARAEVLPVDVWYDLRTFWQMPRQTQVAWNAEEVKGWWSTVQASSSVISRMPWTLYQWHGLMNILMHADVSRIKHMVLGIELHTTDEDKTIAYNLLGIALRFRDFSNLKTLILHSGNDESSGLGAPPLKVRPTKQESPSPEVGNAITAWSQTLVLSHFDFNGSPNLPHCPQPVIA